MKNAAASLSRNAILALLLIGCVPARVMAASVTVTNTNDNLVGSLRQAIQDAPAGSTIVFNIPTDGSDTGYNPATGVCTITLTSGELIISKNLTISGASRKIVVQRASPGADPRFRIFNITNGVVTLANLTIANGAYLTEGSGIYNSSSLTLRNCTLIDNKYGGILNTSAGTLTVSNCTITGSSGASGISNFGMLTVTDSTFFNNYNFASGTGGGIYNDSVGTARVGNSIIVGSASDPHPDVSGAFTSRGYNFIGDAGSSSGFGTSGSHDQIGNNVNKADAQLSPLQYNGGSTPTMAPRYNSKVIDEGNSRYTADQRARLRPVDQPGITDAGGGDGSDIGAVEVSLLQSGAALAVNTLAEHDDGACTTDDCSLLEALDMSNANSDASTINFRSGLSGIIKNTLAPDGLSITGPVSINGPGARVLTISGNSSVRVFSVTGGPVFIAGLTVAHGHAGGNGGAIASSSNLTLTNCALAANSATVGGGLYNDAGGQVVLNNCTFSDNTADYGAGLDNEDTAHITNCTFSSNKAVFNGGAIMNNGGSLNVRHCTITGNSVSDGDVNSGGGGIDDEGNTGIPIGDTIVVGNTAVNGPNGRGSFSSQDYNLIGNPNGSTGFTNGVQNDQVGVALLDVKLDTLKNNGGPTDTMALLRGSKAIDAGSCGSGADAVTTDQRGRKRPFDDTTMPDVADACDIGAFEAGPLKIRPDALIRTSAETIFSGNNFYNLDGTSQTKSTTMQLGSTATYFIKVQTDGDFMESLKVTGPGGGSGWTVQYFDTASGANVTALVTGAGWRLSPLPAQGSRVLRLTVRPGSSVPGGSMKNVLVTVTSLTNSTKQDAVKATPTVASSAAPQ